MHSMSSVGVFEPALNLEEQLYIEGFEVANALTYHLVKKVEEDLLIRELDKKIKPYVIVDTGLIGLNCVEMYWMTPDSRKDDVYCSGKNRDIDNAEPKSLVRDSMQPYQDLKLRDALPNITQMNLTSSSF